MAPAVADQFAADDPIALGFGAEPQRARRVGPAGRAAPGWRKSRPGRRRRRRGRWPCGNRRPRDAPRHAAAARAPARRRNGQAWRGGSRSPSPRHRRDGDRTGRPRRVAARRISRCPPLAKRLRCSRGSSRSPAGGRSTRPAISQGPAGGDGTRGGAQPGDQAGQRVRRQAVIGVEEQHRLGGQGRAPPGRGCARRRRLRWAGAAASAGRRRRGPTTSAVASVEPSSTTTMRQSAWVWSRTERMAAPIQGAMFQAGVTIPTRIRGAPVGSPRRRPNR